ncbi:MAG: 50S ribosomal protein L14e [Candidatus Woesearchaeota archaeon]
MDIGRVCVKIAGRDSGKICVITQKIDDNFVIVDGFTRNKKVNIEHLEPLPQVIKNVEKLSKEQILKELEKIMKSKTSSEK